MQAVLVEIKRVLKSTGREIFVVGRESMVRGIPFENGGLVASLASIGGFRVALRQERCFQNKFGKAIVEDILYLDQALSSNVGDPRTIACDILSKKLLLQMPDAVRRDLENAIKLVDAVLPSPLYKQQTNF